MVDFHEGGMIMEAELDTTYLMALARLFPPQGKWTEQDYFALPQTNEHIELANGRITVSPGPDNAHQFAVEELYSALRAYAQPAELGRARFAPFDVRLFPDTIRQPDVFFIRKEHMDRVTRRFLDGPPDWVAEVISTGSRTVDEEEKLHEYAQAGVPEYWLVDPEDRSVRVYVLPEGKESYNLAATYTAEQTARSETLPGFEVPVASIC
jgi:Uma2 family endonuclease